MERTYYILRNNQQEGPFTRQEILQMALPDQTLLWSEGWTRWLPLAEVDDFSPTQEGGELPPALPEEERKGPAREYHLANLREQIGVFTPAKPAAATPPPYQGASASSEVPPSFSGATREWGNTQSRVYTPEPSLWSYFIGCITKRFAQFSGRARRREFWGFVLFSFIFRYLIQFFSSFILFPFIMSDVFGERIFDAYMSGGIIDMYGEIFRNPGFITTYGLLTVVSLFLMIPSLAVSVRRLHDIGKSGWFLLITLIPVVGSIIFIIYAAQEGVRRPNKYGEDPKAPQTPN